MTFDYSEVSLELMLRAACRYADGDYLWCTTYGARVRLRPDEIEGLAVEDLGALIHARAQRKNPLGLGPGGDGW